jgi:hypothetical protein
MTHITTAALRTTRSTIRTTLAGILAASTLLATVACAGADASTGPTTGRGKTTNPGPGANVAGLYALMTVNKKAIPFQIFRGRYYYAEIGYTFDDLSITVTGGELTLQADGQFHLAVDFRFAANGGDETRTRSFNGRYRVNGEQITLTDAGGSVTGGFRNGIVSVDIDPGTTGGWQTYYFQFVP